MIIEIRLCKTFFELQLKKKNPQLNVTPVVLIVFNTDRMFNYGIIIRKLCSDEFGAIT